MAINNNLMIHVDGCCLHDQGSHACLMWLHSEIHTTLLLHQKVSCPKMFKYYCLARGLVRISFKVTHHVCTK